MLLLLLLTFLLYLLSTTADSFFCPTLQSIVEYFKISPNLAGVTFLSFGNGSPDVFSNIAAFASQSPNLGIAGIVGGGLFVSCVVTASVGMASLGYAQIDFLNHTRDVTFYLISVSYLLLTCLDGKVEMMEAIGFLLIYGLYVSIVMLLEHRHGKPLQPCDVLQHDVQHVVQDVHKQQYDEGMPLLHRKNSAPTPRARAFSMKRYVVRSMSLDDPEGLPDRKVTLGFGRTAKRWTRQYRTLDSIEELGNDSPPDMHSVRYEPQKTNVWTVGILGIRKIVWNPIVGIATFGRKLTIPLLDVETWNYYYAVVNPVCMLALLLWTVKDYSIGEYLSWEVVGIVGLLSNIAIAVTCNENKPPKGLVFVVLLLSAFTMSMLWIMNLASEVLALLLALGKEFHISSSILGVTVLAWGNSLGDLVSNTAISKDGFPEMAFAGCFAGPMFNMLIGLGLSLVIVIARDGPFYIGHISTQVFFNFGFLYCSLIMNLVFPGLLRFQYPKWMCYGLLVIYISFVITTLFIQATKF